MSASTCPTCSEAIPQKARFCPFCGARQAEHEALRDDEGGEHRQITVMFCDVVGSTGLSASLDAEDLRELLRTYQRLCATAIESRGGMIAQYLGDGIMAYFGYPRAHEDAAIRAADAALEITAKVREIALHSQLAATNTFAVRVALHTGRVLIGTMGAGARQEHHSVTGVVPNLTSRIEAFAPENGVAVSAETRALIQSAFRLESIGAQSLKGLPAQVEVFHLIDRVPATSVLPTITRVPFGRDCEIATLASIWEGTPSHGGTRVVITAEAGAGKSALVSSFLQDADVGRQSVVEIAGTVAGRNTPFACLRNMILRWATAARSDQPGDQATRIAEWFDAEDMADALHANVLNSLCEDLIEDGTAGRQAIFSAFCALLDRMQRPLILVVEDAHWVDYSTLELVDLVGSRRDSGIMAIIMTRPGLEMTWTDPRQTEITLAGLSPEPCTTLIEETVGGRVEPLLSRRIIKATNGLPLYVEELTKSLLESGRIRHERGLFRFADPDESTTTPTSLLDLITERLDTLGEAKLFAQISSVLGGTFERAALADVSGAPPDAVDTAISALTMSGILSIARGGALSFRHALYQNAAYESIVRRARLVWHERYLRWLEKNPTRLDAARPENIGYHMEACGRTKDAVEQYISAGHAATRASASHEAAAHFRRAATLLAELGDQASVTDRLRAQVLLASALLTARGPGAPETRKAYSDAFQSAESAPESEYQLPAYWGWWRVSDSFSMMADRAQRLLTVSERMQGNEFKLQAKHCVWANAFQMGNLGQSIENAREGLVLYQAGGFEDRQTLYGGHDCKVCALGEIGLASWLQGAGDAAAQHVEAAVAHAEHLGHLGSRLHALDIAVMLHHYRRDARAAQRTAERLMNLASDSDLEDYRAKAEIFLGWVQIETETDVQSGLAMVNRGFQTLREIGTPEDFPVYQCIRSVAMRRLGRVDDALNALYDGRAVIDDEGVNYWGAEIARNEAEAELLRPKPLVDFMNNRLREACDLAKAQGALALELRTAMTGLRWSGQRRSGQGASGQAGSGSGGDETWGRENLRSVVNRFDASAKGRDLDDARQMLAMP